MMTVGLRGSIKKAAGEIGKEKICALNSATSLGADE